MNTCVDPDIPHKYLRFIIIDSVNNTEDLEEEEIDSLLIEKEQFWIGTLHTYPFGLNSAHDLHRKLERISLVIRVSVSCFKNH